LFLKLPVFPLPSILKLSTMNSTIQYQLDRIETALTTLTDSIASYNPSVTAVHDLLAADDALTEGLNQCEYLIPSLDLSTPTPLPPPPTNADKTSVSTHQANNARILSLHSTSTSLTTTLTNTLTTLSALRASILAAPATTQTPSQRPIPSSTLLDYAKNISRYTAPPSLREKLLAAKATLPSEPSKQQPSTQQTPSTEPSTQQPSTQPNTQQELPIPNGTSIPTPFHPATDNPTTTSNPGISSLTAPEIQWLDPALHAPFLAWPSEDRIRRGGLAALQAKLESGEDIEAGVDGESGVKGGDGGVGEGERDAMEGVTREVKDKRDRYGVRGGRVMENGVGPGGGREKKPSVFSGLDMYDLEDE